jgi:hypothetical protein
MSDQIQLNLESSRKELREHGPYFRLIATLARDFIHDPEMWESYMDSKKSNSLAWDPRFLLLAQAVEKFFGPPTIESDEEPK